MGYIAIFTFDKRRDFDLDICPVTNSYKSLEDIGMHIMNVLQKIDKKLGTDTYYKHGMRLYRWKLYKPYNINLKDDKLNIAIIPTIGLMSMPLKN